MLVAALVLLPPQTYRPIPVLPPLASGEFQSQVFAVAAALEANDFAKAGRLVNGLPRASFAIQWDDRKVPAGMRPEIRIARDRAIQAWREYFPGATTFVPSTATTDQADIRISFEPQLATDPALNAPAGVVTFVGSKRPWVEAVLGIQRGAPLQMMQLTDVANDVQLVIGSYLGVARNVAPGNTMTPSIAGSANRSAIGVVERVAAARNLAIATALRTAVKERAKVKILRSDAFLDPLSFSGRVTQGDKAEIPVQITNRGDGPLSFRVDGDCGCMVPTPPGEIPAKATRVIPVSFDTKEFSSAARRVIRVYTNDPDMPVQEIPVDLDIVPRFRFIAPGGPARNLAESKTFEVYLALPDNADMKVLGARMSGIDSKVTFEPWKGSLVDPARGGGPEAMHGFKFHVEVGNAMVAGRAQVGLNVSTDDPGFPMLSFPMTVQRGIVALPEELFMGEMSRVPRRMAVTITRANGPLKITSVSIDATSLRVTASPGRNASEQRITVEYDGKAPAGELSATITVRLDDPKQPVIKIPVTGSVR